MLLDDRHVLTCAHVVGDGDDDEPVSVRSAVCQPEWSVTARLAPGSRAFRGDTRRGDVALLVLDEPTPCAARARLWCAPISGGRVRVHGFPQAERYGMSVDAELAGDGGRGGELGLLNRVRADGQWIEPGYSGAGVMMLDGDHAGHVIGIVVADFRNADARAAWMIPTETIREYLPGVAAFVAGEPMLRGLSGGGLPELKRGDTLRVALTRELTRLLSSGWTGTVVLPGGTAGTGTAWLVRLLRTADPATRAGTSDAQFAGAPRDTVLGLGSIDAAYDARGRSVSEITHYLAERFGLPPGEPDLIHRLLRRVPPACVVIVGVDRAQSPDALMREVLRPLAVAARSRGVRLVIGFDGPLPERKLPYEVALSPEPLVGSSRHGVTAAAAQARVAELAAAEDAAAQLSARNERRFREPPALPRARAPGLRVRLAVARVTEPDPELAEICQEAVSALGQISSFTLKSRHLDKCLEDLRGEVDASRDRAARYFGAEDQPLADWYDQAAGALFNGPIDLAAARQLAERYIAEIARRTGVNDEGEKDHG